MKKAIFLIIILTAIYSQVTFCTTSEAINSARILYDLGLFSGIGVDEKGNPNFDLDREPTRQEAIAMLVKLLGKENEAKNGKWVYSFKDVDQWAAPYVGYAYANGLTSGKSQTVFGSKDLVTANQYLTFILKALGYNGLSDFTLDKANVLSDKLGLTNGEFSKNSTILRGDIASISKKSLLIQTKEQKLNLLENLYFSNSIKLETISKNGYAKYITVQAISDHLEQFNIVPMFKPTMKLDFSEYIWRLVGKPTVLEIGDKKYFMSITFVKDINNNYYVELDGLTNLLPIAYGDYYIEEIENPFVDGRINSKNTESYRKLSHEGISLNKMYPVNTYYNKDLTKSFKVIAVDYQYKDLRNPENNYKVFNSGYPPVVSLSELENALGGFHVDINTSDALEYYLIKISH